MSRACTFACAQTVPIAGDVDANLAQHLALARVAAEQGARVLVFPELSLTGYELERADALAFSRDDARLAPLAALARESALTLVVGAPLRLGSRLHVAAFALAPDGSHEVYTKRHLGAFGPEAAVDGHVPPPESRFFAPGALDPLLALGDERAALAVCADTGRPSHPQHAAERGATAYLASMFVIPSALAAETAVLAGHATKHHLTLVMANFGGPSGGLAAGGGSAIWSPDGALRVRLPAAGPGVAVAACGRDGEWSARALPAPGA